MNDGEDECRDAESGGDCAGHVEADVALIAGLFDDDLTNQCKSDDRDVNPERCRPVPLVYEETTDGGAEADTHSSNGGPDRNRLAALIPLERVGHDAQRGGQHECCTEALRRASNDEHWNIACERTDDRAGSEDEEPECHPTFPTKPVSDRPSEHQKAGQYQYVSVDDPLQFRRRRAEIHRDRGECGVHDREVEEHDQGAQRHHRQDQPATRIAGLYIGPFGTQYFVRHCRLLVITDARWWVNRIVITNKRPLGSNCQVFPYR